MQVWTPSTRPRNDGVFAVDLNPGDGKPFAIISLSEDGTTALVIQSVYDADRLIRAAAEAKDQLIEATGAVVRVAVPMCPAEHPSGAWGCTLDAGHDGPHKSVDTNGDVRKEWDNEHAASRS